MDRRVIVHHVNSKTELLIACYNRHPKNFYAIFAITVIFTIFFSFYQFVIISFFAIAGIIVADSFLRSNASLEKIKETSNEVILDYLKNEKKCPVCGSSDCQRHRPGLSISSIQPWLQLKIPTSVNDSLEEFFNIILDSYVYTWYNELSKDEVFIDELRFNIRYIVSTIFQRLKRVDLAKLVTQNVLCLSLKHLSISLEVVNKYGKDYEKHLTLIEDKILKLYSSNIHAAARNRKAEIEYLKQLSEKIFTFVLPTHSQHCRILHSLIRELLTNVVLLPSLDLIADPYIINEIVILIFSKSRATDFSNLPPSPHVQIMSNFTRVIIDENQKASQLKLSQVLIETDLLYSFMQFMKTEGTVNVLQFYLQIEEFNRKILTPELSNSKIFDLHSELNKIYQDFVDPDAFERIHLSKDIIDDLQNICKGPIDSILKLQTTTPLFRAYEHTYDLLENTFLPLFQQSDIYYSMVCGDRWANKLQKNNSRSLRKTFDAMSRLSTIIKSAFKSNNEGKLSTDENDISEIDDSFKLSCPTIPENSNREMHQSYSSSSLDKFDLETTLRSPDVPLRDLSKWRVTIPKVITKCDQYDPKNPKKFSYAYAVEVHMMDAHGTEGHEGWSIDRKYQEFYVLESKLKEFHGEFENLQLPPKRTFNQKDKPFLESIRTQLETFLQILLTKQTLHGSELIYSFLKSEQEFTTKLEINLGKKVKSGAMKLVKEKGQHLETFLKSFLSSIETVRSKPVKYSDKESDSISISSEKMTSSIFGNNANIDISVTDNDPMSDIQVETNNEVRVSSFTSGVRSDRYSNSSLLDEIFSLYDAILYLIDSVFMGSVWLMRVLLMFRIFVRDAFDNFLLSYTRNKFNQLLNEHQITQIINLLRDILFFDNDPPRTENEKFLRKKEALKEISEFIPNIFTMLVGSENKEFGCTLLFNLLQLPKLNKQLSYMLLDEAVLQLFPELKDNFSTS